MTNNQQPQAASSVTKPIGQWQSPISAASLSQANIRLGEPSLHDGCAYWLEGRPSEKGRTVLVKRNKQGKVVDLTPAPYNVRSSAHEYGGGSYQVNCGINGDCVFFINHTDQGIYQIGGDQITSVFQCDGLRFADMVFDKQRRNVIAVAEDHRESGEPKNFLCQINVETKALTVLHQGADFYSSPTLNNQGTRLAWLTWMHPYMPWENTQLNIASFTDIESSSAPHADPKTNSQQDSLKAPLAHHQTIGDNESIFQPIFGPNGQLYFASDRNNWWNIYALDFNEDATDQQSAPSIKAVTSQDAEFALPQWVFNMRTFGFIDSQTIIASRVVRGVWDVCQIDVKSGNCQTLDVASKNSWPYPAVEHLATSDNNFICLASGAATAQSIVLFEANGDGNFNQHILQSASDIAIDKAYISIAEAMEFSTSEDQTSHGFYYAPTNPIHALPDGEAPPLLVLVHGGPTAATNGGFDPRIQFWTSRGFAVLDVNYRGSTGYGRDYRRQLNLQWGLKDVQDCVQGAQHLIDRDKADANRLYIMGGSAGGYTVLGVLAFTQFFHGGISSYGIGDLEVLLGDTHKFESRYTYSLVGEYDEQLYRARSPLYSANKITAPILFFQGTEDKVVPPNQAELMVAALKENGIATKYVKFEGEGHGFRRSDSIETMLNTSLDFLTDLATHS